MSPFQNACYVIFNDVTLQNGLFDKTTGFILEVKVVHSTWALIFISAFSMALIE